MLRFRLRVEIGFGWYVDWFSQMSKMVKVWVVKYWDLEKLRLLSKQWLEGLQRVRSGKG